MLPTKEKPELFVIDANGFLHRNYHALPKLSTSKGEEVGALYGFVNWLLRFAREKRPAYAVICFDSKGPTFRHDIYKEYKANRPPTDDALVRQLKIARDVARTLGFKILAAQGAEADDLMACAALSARKEGAEVVLITSDKDIYQIIGPGVSMWSGSSKEAYKDNSSCVAKFGIDCKFVPDYLAIVGDSSDNVPGIAGLGPKAAVELITNFGSLENILKAAAAADSKIKPAMLEKIISGRESALLSKKLVLLDDGIMPDIRLDDCKVSPPDKHEAAELVKRFEFKNLLAFVEEFSSGPAPVPAAAKAPVQGDLFEDSGEDRGAGSCDFEDILLKSQTAQEVFLYSEEGWLVLALSPAEYGIIENNKITAGQTKILRGIIAPDTIFKIGHDIKFTLRTLGYDICPPALINCFDSALAKYCIDPSGEFSLSGVLAVNIKVVVSPAESIRRRMALYAQNIWRLKDYLERGLAENNQREVFLDMETPLMSALLNMETNGIMVDTAWLKTLDILLTKEMSAEQKATSDLAGGDININSPKQLGILLYEQLKLPAVKKNKTGYSTDEEALSHLKTLHPVAEHILKYRESAKLRSTYVDSLLTLAGSQSRRVHTTFNQTGTVTGRLSSFSPNLQNIPIRTEKGRLIRQAFVAPQDKVLLSVDYSQIDLRILAHESGDENLINAFLNNADIHTQTAAEVFNLLPELVTKEQRSRAKAINFGIVYGQGPNALSESLGITVREAKEYIDAYFARYRTLKKWLDDTAAQARKAGYVKTLSGHIRYMPEFESASARLASFANRASVNTVVQGGSSDVIKKAMIDIYKEIPPDVLMLLQVHDELVFEVPQGQIKETAAWVKEKMETAVALKVPLVAEAKAGKNWNEMGKVL